VISVKISYKRRKARGDLKLKDRYRGESEFRREVEQNRVVNTAILWSGGKRKRGYAGAW
jgi:hypothetical protein